MAIASGLSILFILILLFSLRQKNNRRPILFICFFTVLPLIISPLLFPEFSRQFSSWKLLFITSWQLIILFLLLTLIFFGFYYSFVRRYTTPAIHPDRWKLSYTIVGSAIFFLLLLLRLPILSALTLSLFINIAITLFLKRQLIIDVLFSGMSLGLVYIFLFTVAQIVLPSPLNDLWREVNAGGISPLGLPLAQLVALFLLGFLWGPLYLGIKDPHQKEDAQAFQAHHLNLKRIISLTLLSSIVFTVLWFCFFYIFRPQKVQANLPSTQDVSLNKEISLTFSRPIDRSTVRFRIVPEIEGDWELRETSLGDRVFKTIAFQPKNYFLPEQDYSIEIEDIRSLVQTTQQNFAYSFETESPPTIKEIIPTTDATNIVACAPLKVAFSKTLESYWRPEFKLDPSAEITVLQQEDEFILTPMNCLEQGTSYTMTIYNRIEGDTREIPPLATTRFETKLAPALTDHSPKGSGIFVSTKQINLTFNQPMKTDAPESFASVLPNIPGSWQWEPGGLTLRYILTNFLSYDTRYTVTLKKGMPDQNKGFLEEDSIFTFSTIGPVIATLTTPSSGSKEIKPETSIQVQFNQEVDHASAEQHFFITPDVHGSFSWKNNLMSFQPNSALAYSTNYSVGVKAGVKSTHGLDQSSDLNGSFTTKAPPPIPITLGYSEEGRAINGYKFGNGSEVFLLFGAIHGGKEKSSGQLLNTFVQELAKDPAQVAGHKTILIIPIANPDGYIERTDKLNSRGINLNRNFDTSNWTEAGWDTEGSIGSEPFSEKESRVIRDVVQKYGVKSMLAYHSQGGVVNPEFNNSSQELAKSYANQTGYGYYQDTAWNYPGTATRWFVEKYGGAGVTIELTSHTVADYTRHKKALFDLVK